jgi:hypothetical protein
MTGDIQARLYGFARAILEWRGAVVEWPEGAGQGEALAPPDVAAALHSPESLTLSYQPGTADLCANLATDFVERIGALFEGQPAIGVFQIPELYLKKSAMEGPFQRTFTWLNASVRFRGSGPARIEYHTWHFHASLQSDDQWEDVFAVTINAASRAEIVLPDLLALESVEPNLDPVSAPPETYPRAVQRALAQVESRSAGFVARLESRLVRDRRRLRDYYHALLRETKAKLARSKTEEEAHKQEDLSRAVNLELRRKLVELDDRYAIAATLTPLVHVRTEIPVLALEFEVRRRQSHRTHAVYWNPLLKEIEPMGCHQCGASIFAVAFTDNDVAPLCSTCAG